MKYFSFVFFLVICVFGIRFSNEEEVMFMKSIGIGDDAKSFDMIQTQSKSCNLVSVGMQNTDGVISLLLTGFENDGHICYMYEYYLNITIPIIPTNEIIGVKVVESGEDGGYIVGTQGLNSIISFNETGKIRWMKNFFPKHNASYFGYFIQINSMINYVYEGKAYILIAGSVEIPDISKVDNGVLAMLSLEKGEIISFKSWGKYHESVWFYDLTTCGENYVCVLGSVVDSIDKRGGIMITRFKIIKNGFIFVRSYRYSDTITEISTDSQSIRYDNKNSRIYICGSNDNVYFISRIDILEDGSFKYIWGTKLSEVFDESYCNSVFVADNGEMIKSVGFGGVFGPLFVDITSDYGDLNATKTIDPDLLTKPTTQSEFRSIHEVYSNQQFSGYVISGKVFLKHEADYSSLLVMKTGKDGFPCITIDETPIFSSFGFNVSEEVLKESFYSNIFNFEDFNFKDYLKVKVIKNKYTQSEELKEFNICWSCNGKYQNTPDICFNHGSCSMTSGDCDCFQGWLADSQCSIFDCFGERKNSSKVCSGNGDCTGPNECSCKENYSSKDDCSLYKFVFPNWLIVTISAFFGSFAGILILICCFLFYFLVCLSCCIFVFCCYYISMINKKLLENKLSKNYTRLLINEEDGDSEYTQKQFAKIQINSELFKIDYEKEIRLERVIDMNSTTGTSLYIAKWIGGGGNRRICFKKFQTKQLFSSQQNFEDFEKEISIAASISHPHITSVFGATLHPVCGIVMEYLEKGDLKKFILSRNYNKKNESGKYPLREKIRLLMEVTTAMQFIHSRNMIHRDLKCENCLVDSQERVKLSDFGISRIFTQKEDRTRTRNLGTSIYMAPELTTSKYDNKVDVFSFGILIFCLITENFSPYGESEGFVEIKVSRNPNYRPNEKEIDLVCKEEYEGSDSSFLSTIASECWNHNPKDRKSFADLYVSFELYLSSLL